MPVQPIDYDGKIRLWCHNQTTPHLIITAHGEHTNIFSKRFSRNFRLPAGKQLHFYTPNHTAMTDRSLAAIARESQVESDAGMYVGPRTTANYNLFHYETDRDFEIPQVCNTEVGLGYPDVVQILEANEKGSALSEVLKIIHNRAAARYEAYTDIHCSFCRVGYQWRAHRFD